MAGKTKAPKVIRKLADLSLDTQNANQGTERGLGMLEHSLRSYGAGRSILVDRNGNCIAGNKTLERAVDLGLDVEVVRTRGDRLVVVQREDLDITDLKARELAIADNRVAEVDLSWDAATLKALQADGADLDAFFLPDELEEMFNDAAEAIPGHTDPDDVPDVRTTSIKLGDVFELGVHRLMCGDCTDAGMVEQLMGGVRAGLMNTDPPYGVTYANDDRPNPGVAKPRVAKPRVANDTLSDAALQQFLESAFGTAKHIALGPTAAWYLWHAHLTQGYFAAAAAAAVILHRQIIWVKPVLLLGRGHYHWKHEPCFMGWVDGHQPPDYGLGQGERTQTTIWEVDGVKNAERKEFNHSTPKPVGLFMIPIVKHLRAGEACYEPFAGSGPQFIAAEQHSVRCFGLELEPRFCQVIIDRWEKFTGLKAKKAGEVKPKLKKRRAA